MVSTQVSLQRELTAEEQAAANEAGLFYRTTRGPCLAGDARVLKRFLDALTETDSAEESVDAGVDE